MVLWVFGYGSLIWKTGFDYDERVVGYIKNYKRAYTQGSIDHRGTIEKPGRTVTLEYEEGAITWGAAYRISGQEEEKSTLEYLDVRERLYDIKEYLDVYTIDSSDKPAITGVLTYIATGSCHNLCYLGPAPIEDMARQIATAHGPSGPNTDYLFNLEKALLEIGVECLDEVTRRLSLEMEVDAGMMAEVQFLLRVAASICDFGFVQVHVPDEDAVLLMDHLTYRPDNMVQR